MKVSAVFAVAFVVLLSEIALAQITVDNVQLPTSVKSEVAHRTAGKPGPLPSLRSVAKRVNTLLEKSAKSRSVSEQIESTLELVKATNEVSADPRLSSSSALQGLRVRLLQQLRKIEKTTKSAERRRKRRPESIEVKREVLAQLNQVVNGANVGNGPVAQNVGPQDYGPMLVQLIQRTISPQSWDVNGGASTIQYWKPGMALVIRAPQGVHSEVAPILGQLRQQ